MPCNCQDHLFACHCEKRPKIPPEPVGWTRPLDHFQNLIDNPPPRNDAHWGFPTITDEITGDVLSSV
jgi:hypothetical protein